MLDETPIDATTAPSAVTEPEVAPQPIFVKVKMNPFDAIQQETVTKLIITAKSEAAKQLRRDHAETLRELAALRASIDLPKDTADELAATSERLTAARKELADVTATNLAESKRQALQSAAQSVNFFDSSVGATLMAAETTFVDGVLTVIDPATGEPRINSQGESMTVRELAASKAAALPWAIRGDFKGGAGSVQAQSRVETVDLASLFGPHSDGAAAQRLGKTDMPRYRRLREQYQRSVGGN